MSWSITKSSDKKQELKDEANNNEYVPQSVRDVIATLADAFPDGKLLHLSSSGHHNNDKLANISISINAQ